MVISLVLPVCSFSHGSIPKLHTTYCMFILLLLLLQPPTTLRRHLPPRSGSICPSYPHAMIAIITFLHYQIPTPAAIVSLLIPLQPQSSSLPSSPPIWPHLHICSSCLLPHLPVSTQLRPLPSHSRVQLSSPLLTQRITYIRPCLTPPPLFSIPLSPLHLSAGRDLNHWLFLPSPQLPTPTDDIRPVELLQQIVLCSRLLLHSALLKQTNCTHSNFTKALLKGLFQIHSAMYYWIFSHVLSANLVSLNLYQCFVRSTEIFCWPDQWCAMTPVLIKFLYSSIISSWKNQHNSPWMFNFRILLKVMPSV